MGNEKRRDYRFKKYFYLIDEVMEMYQIFDEDLKQDLILELLERSNHDNISGKTEDTLRKALIKKAEEYVSYSCESLIDNQECTSLEDIVNESLFKQALIKVLDTLPEREKDVLIRRFGLFGEPQQSLQEVGSVYGVNRERVRQIECRAIRRLRHPRRAKIILVFNED